MGLLRKKAEPEEEKTRDPVRRFDREDYIQIRSSNKKTVKDKSKGDEKDMTEKKETTKKTGEKAPAEKKTVKSTEKKETAKKTSEAAEKKPAKTAEKKEVAAKTDSEKPAATKKSEEKAKVWHITKRDDVDKWQVKAEGNEKATKLFRTKAEAQEYVKNLSANNEGSRVVSHKKDGKFQKK